MYRAIYFCLIGFSLAAQPRKEKPLPQFREEPLNVIEEGITGWSYSLDGQWVSFEKHIPPIAISTAKREYKSDEAQLGLDNIQQMMLVPAKYGNDTLVTLLKIYIHGEYEFPISKKNWEEETYAYYFIFKAHHLNKLKSFDDTVTKNIRIPLLDGGTLRDLKPKNAIEEMNKNVVIRNRYDRDLVFTMQKRADQPVLMFQFYSMHEIFPDLEGVFSDYTRHGTTLYNTTELLKYLHYTMDLQKFREFFTLEGNLFTVD